MAWFGWALAGRGAKAPVRQECYRDGMTLSPAMRHALDLAAEAAARGEVPVGAVVSDAAGRIVAAAANRTLADRDPSAHAEMLAVRAACARLGTERLVGYDL